jgi:hypothetical protein
MSLLRSLQESHGFTSGLTQWTNYDKTYQHKAFTAGTSESAAPWTSQKQGSHNVSALVCPPGYANPHYSATVRVPGHLFDRSAVGGPNITNPSMAPQSALFLLPAPITHRHIRHEPTTMQMSFALLELLDHLYPYRYHMMHDPDSESDS